MNCYNSAAVSILSYDVTAKIDNYLAGNRSIIMQILDEKSMQALEREIPNLAEGATKQAYVKALASGSSVVKTKGNQLVEIFSDGSTRVLKELKASKKVDIGSTVRLQA